MNKINKFFLCASIAIGSLIIAPHAHADAMIKSAQITKTGPLKLAPNAVEILKFDQDIGTVIIANPDIADVVVENARQIIVRPVVTGATALTILNRTGEVIYKRDVLINNRHGKFVRVRRICGDTSDCLESGTYYCPDGCYEVFNAEGKGGSAGGSSAPASSGGGSSAAPSSAEISDISLDQEEESVE